MTWTATDELLASAWTLDHLQVYGDHLQEREDPRGELVAIDLHIARAEREPPARGSPSPDLLHRKRNRIRTWLGLDREVDPTRGPWSQVEFAYGFVIDVRSEQLARVLASPAAPFVRGVTLTGKTPLVEAGLADLAKQSRPWLARLTVAPRFKGRPPDVWTEHAGHQNGNLSNAAIPSLIAATPRLAELRLCGHRLIRTFPHPAVRRIRIDGINALQSLLVEHEPMPAVTELVFGYAHEPGALISVPRPPPPLIPPATFPALRRLDLSPNEELRAITDTQLDVFEALARFTALPQIEELRIPSVRNENEAVYLQRALDRMPALRRLEIVRSCAVQLRTRAERVIEELPWPRIEWARGVIELQFRGARRPHLLGMVEAVRFCDARFREFDEIARAAWTELWQRALSPEVQRLSVRTLTRALDALGYIDGSFPRLKPWALLRETARDADPDDEVVIARTEGRLR